MNKAMENQMSMVRNFSPLVGFRLDKPEPMVMSTMAMIIRLMWMILKKLSSMFCSVSFNGAPVNGLLKYNINPSIS